MRKEIVRRERETERDRDLQADRKRSPNRAMENKETERDGGRDIYVVMVGKKKTQTKR